MEVDGQQVRRVAVQDVDEEVQLHRLLAVVHLAVAEHRAAVDVERADAAVQDAVGAGDAALEHELPLAVGEVVVDAHVELRLRRALVVVVGILRAGAVGDRAGRPRQRILRVEARRDLVRPAIVDGLARASR